MSAVTTNSFAQDRHGQALLNDIVRRFADLLIASGATIQMIRDAMSKAIATAVDSRATTTFTELGALLRDCMEVMCTWRRDVDFVDKDGEPKPLARWCGNESFDALCTRAGCNHLSSEILNVLLEFGAASIADDGTVVSETPTFLLARAAAGGRLATDGLLKQLEGFLQALHRNVCSMSGIGKPKFERACTVSVAIELEPIFDRLVRNRGQEFIDSIDEWLERNAKYESVSGRYLELGAGAYFIDLGERPTRTKKG